MLVRICSADLTQTKGLQLSFQPSKNRWMAAKGSARIGQRRPGPPELAQQRLQDGGGVVVGCGGRTLGGQRVMEAESAGVSRFDPDALD
jgi:hypothetical protein